VIYNKEMFAAKGVPPEAGLDMERFINALVKCTDKANGVAGFAPWARAPRAAGLHGLHLHGRREVEQVRDGKTYRGLRFRGSHRAAQLFKD